MEEQKEQTTKVAVKKNKKQKKKTKLPTQSSSSSEESVTSSSSAEVKPLKSPKQASPNKQWVAGGKLCKRALKQFDANVEALVKAVIPEDKQESFPRPKADKPKDVDEFIAGISDSANANVLGDMLHQNGLPKGKSNKSERIKTLLFHLIVEPV